MPEITPEIVTAAIDSKTTESRPVEPMTVAVIGTGDGSKLPTGAIATTQGEHEPNLIVQVISPLVAILVRSINTYITILVGLVAAGMTSNVIPASDFLHLVYKCAGLAVAGAAFGFLKDLVTVFGRLEQRFPLATGSV